MEVKIGQKFWVPYSHKIDGQTVREITVKELYPNYLKRGPGIGTGQHGYWVKDLHVTRESAVTVARASLSAKIAKLQAELDKLS